ncbi:CHAT domain-containing protein [Vibrio sp. HN007]|uniref:CHAT domain-containing protein n=1 Tax=Vibrio iocasae TaxID=3098914 RepID=UPI0035D3E973
MTNENMRLQQQAEEQSAYRYLAMQDIQKRKRLKPKWSKHTEEAQRLIKRNDRSSLIQAEKQLLKALKIASTNSLARASTCHDLGVLYFTYLTELPGGTSQNLLKAIQYLSRAIDTPERQKYPEKHASSVSQLAATYRRAALEYLWPEDGVNCLERAQALHLKAVGLLSNSKIPAIIQIGQLSIVYFNLASVLLDQGLTQRACEIQAESVELYLAYHSVNLPSFMEVIPPMQALGLSFARLMHFSKYQQHKDLCETILDRAPQFGLDPLAIMTVNPKVDLSEPETQITYLVAKAYENPTEMNVTALKRKQAEIMDNRRFCRNDAESDNLAALAQRACSGLGRILIQKDDALGALRFLENCSALRFCESADKHWKMPSEKLGLKLWPDLLELGSTQFNLNELALMLEHVEEENLKPAIQACYERSLTPWILDDLIESTTFFNEKNYPQVLINALNERDPIGFFRKQSGHCLEDFQKVEQLIYELDPSFTHQKNSDLVIKNAHFEQALSSHSDLTLVRIDIEEGYDDALILVANMENNRLAVKGHIVNVPDGLINHMGAYIRGEEQAGEQWSLDFVDWRKILPDDCKRIGLLTSFFASQIPWAATGAKGCELYTLVEEVNWLPTILYLCNHVTHFNKRSGSMCINGGDTRFHDVANQYVSNLKGDISKSDFVDEVKNSEIVSYYGHCVHEFPNRPSLKTKNFDLNDLELVNQVAGMERVEFWACQSGSNIPLSVFSIPVNEAFGFDMRVIEWGAVSSIGSLWALPDIVTAHIKSHYDQLMSNGTSPSRALLTAQRWWVKQGAKAELSKMRELGLPSYLSTLGCNETMDGLLGPVKAKGSRNEDELKEAERLFLHPSSWAGLRFCGIAEHINQAVYKDKIDLSADEINQIKSQLAELKLKSGFMNYA